MADTSQVIWKEYPFLSVGMGVVFAVFGLFAAGRPAGLVPGLVLILIGLGLAVGLAAVTTVAVDRGRGTVGLTRRWLYRRTAREVPLADVAGVRVEHSTPSPRQRMRGERPGARVVLVRQSGEVVPLQSAYTSAHRAVKAKAQILREAIGLPPETGNVLDAAWQVASRSPALGRDGVTDGVPWRVEVLPLNRMTITRWQTAAVVFPQGFVYVGQKPRGSRDVAAGGLLGGMVQLALRTSLSMYGFAPHELPGFDNAVPVPLPDDRLAGDFGACSSEPHLAQQFLNPAVSAALAAWADAHPLGKVQRNRPGEFGQLALVCGPEGLSLSFQAALQPPMLDAVAQMGAQIVRALA